VVWFNLGMHHMPHTGDLPNTVFSTAHSAITIEPFNYLPGDPSQASTQQVLIKTTDSQAEITRYGAKNTTCPVDLVRFNSWYISDQRFDADDCYSLQSQLNPDLSQYSNTISVLKFPFDGSKPDRA
jgi:primary-amine oxidase